MTTEAKREAIARIIDPDAWHETLPTDGCGAYWMGRRANARSRADAIMALAEPQVSDAFEVANQLGSYVGPDTEPDLAAFLLAQSEAAAAMGYELERLRAPASEPQALSEERAREVLAAEWDAEGRKDLANTIRNGRDTEWNKAAVAIRAMIRFATETQKGSGE